VCLRLWTTDGGRWGNATIICGMNMVIYHLSRSWLIERGARDVKKDVTITELGRRAREAYNQKIRDYAQHNVECLRIREDTIKAEDFEEEDSVVQVFRRVWPSKESSKDWRDDRSSLPLQV
jgi:hypothetical protein